MLSLIHPYQLLQPTTDFWRIKAVPPVYLATIPDPCGKRIAGTHVDVCLRSVSERRAMPPTDAGDRLLHIDGDAVAFGNALARHAICRRDVVGRDIVARRARPN